MVFVTIQFIKMKKLYSAIALFMLVFLGEATAQNSEMTIPASQEKMNVFYSSSENNIHLSFTIATPSPIEIKIVDITGKEIRTSNMPLQFAGTYSEILERNNLKDGIYIMQVNWGGKRFIKRFIIS